MGSLFENVEDGALRTVSGARECHHCASQEVQVFRFNGDIIDPRHAADPQLAIDDPEVSEVCADCILGGNIRRRVPSEVHDLVSRFASDAESALKAFGVMPGIPLFMQYEDWPIHCGDWTEYQGSPVSADECASVPDSRAYWERGPLKWQSQHPLRPESMTDVNLFRCKACELRLFTFQFT